MDMKKDNHMISKIGRDSSNTMMMMMKSSNTPKSHSLSYLYNNNISQTSYEGQEDYMVNAFSWPPRSYTCSFCKREFRSAQALGGHMNVHRKDRARLRQSPPSDIIHGLYGNTTFLNLNLNHNHNHNPNPNFPGSLNMITTNSNSPPPLSYNSAHNNDIVSSKKWSSTQVNHHHDLTRHINGSDLKLMKSQKLASNGGVREDQKLEGLAKSLKKKIIETPNTVRLDLEIGLVCDSKSEVGLDLDLDLELRLGYSN